MAASISYPGAFADPSDADAKAAAAQRLRIFQMASADNSWVAGGHLSFPGIGHIRAGQGRYSGFPAVSK